MILFGFQVGLQATPFTKQFFENVFQIEMLHFHHLKNLTTYRVREGFQNKILSLIAMILCFSLDLIKSFIIVDLIKEFPGQFASM